MLERIDLFGIWINGRKSTMCLASGKFWFSFEYEVPKVTKFNKLFLFVAFIVYEMLSCYYYLEVVGYRGEEKNVNTSGSIVLCYECGKTFAEAFKCEFEFKGNLEEKRFEKLIY